LTFAPESGDPIPERDQHGAIERHGMTSGIALARVRAAAVAVKISGICCAFAACNFLENRIDRKPFVPVLTKVDRFAKPRWPEGVLRMPTRIAHLSDLHYGSHFDLALWRAVKNAIGTFNPHLLIVSGLRRRSDRRTVVVV
jgi:hypothetical protein